MGAEQVLLVNARSINGKTAAIQDLTLDERADLACITETWLDELGGSQQSYPLVCRLEILENLCEGTIITIKGRIPTNAKRFSINLVCQDEENIAFHFNPRFDNIMVMVFNTMKNGCWGAEERGFGMPFLPGDTIEVEITACRDFYKVYINNKTYTEYKHRMPLKEVQAVVILGDFHLTAINSLSLPSYSPPESKT
ncbi:galectin-7-like [Anolis sagrei]|uniref:galectin-7-like n=1 Tax=Anolis sagrei TaxID=38937 RepID=UPI00352130CC